MESSQQTPSGGWFSSEGGGPPDRQDLAVPLDVSDSRAARKAFQAGVDRFGRLDVANAPTIVGFFRAQAEGPTLLGSARHLEWRGEDLNLRPSGYET